MTSSNANQAKYHPNLNFGNTFPTLKQILHFTLKKYLKNLSKGVFGRFGI